jgi:hypothetical protein
MNQTTYQKLMAEAKAEFAAWEQEQAEAKAKLKVSKLLDSVLPSK